MKYSRVATTALACLIALTHISAQSPIREGDRIAIVGNTFADQLRIHGYLETQLLGHTSHNPVSIRNLGWGGDMLSARDRPTGFPLETSTLTDHKTDVIIACFGMGESFAGIDKVDEFKDQLRAFIATHAGKKYNGESEVRLILVSPIACEDHGALTPALDKRNRDLQAYSLAMQETASGAGLPFVDLFEASRYLMNEQTGPKLTNNGIHLNPYGYWALSHAFKEQLTLGNDAPTHQAWLLRIDAAAKSSEARGVEITGLTTGEDGLQFQVTEKSVPTLGPPTNETLPPQLTFVRDTLAIENLKPGKHKLTIDHKVVAVATATQWAAGVAIDSSPAHDAAQQYRELVNDKNLQFTYSWKALNQVHIVGERRRSPSGKALPAEVIQFAKLAKEREQKLRDGLPLQTRTWRLTSE